MVAPLRPEPCGWLVHACHRVGTASGWSRSGRIPDRGSALPREGERLAAGSRIALCVALALASIPGARAAAASWSFQAALGLPFDLPLPLTIRQSGEEPIRLRARWSARPFEPPLYYDLRVARPAGGNEWALDFVHHKLYLANPPPEVQEFAVSHGFNLLFASGAREVARDTWARVGAGLVLAHPESTVRGRRYDGVGGYTPAGPTLVLGAERRFFPAGRLFFSLQGLAAASWVRVPVAGGSATFADVSVHALGGVGFTTGR